MAQEDSRSILENSTWGIRKRMRDGKFSLAYSRFLGYDKGPDGKLVINEEQAKVVRRIISDYISGKSSIAIAKELQADEIPTASGQGRWDCSAVMRILQNEQYKGDVLIQKTYRGMVRLDIIMFIFFLPYPAIPSYNNIKNF